MASRRPDLFVPDVRAAPELIEQLGDHLGRDPRTVVGHGHGHALGGAPRLQPDAWSAVPVGVVEQVDQDLSQSHRVGHDRRILWDGHLDRRGGRGRRRLKSSPCRGGKFNRLQGDVELTGLDLMDVEEIVYQPIEASRLAIEAIEIFVEVLLVAAATQHG